MTWTSRERVMKTLDFKEPDRVPVDINPVLDAYIDLKKYLNLEIEEDPKPNAAMEVIPHPLVLQKLGVDLISVKLGSVKQVNRAPNEDEWGVIRKRYFQPGGGSYLEAVNFPLTDATLSDLDKYPWPIADLPGRGEGAERMAKRLFEDTDLALVGRFGSSIVETPLYLMGWDNWLMRMASEPEFAERLLDIITDINITFDRIGLEATGKYIQIFKVSGEDLGFQTGPLYSMKMFRKMLLPRFQRRWQAARAYLDTVNPSCKIMLHSCGSIRTYIPDLIDAGIQVLDPVQPLAANMDSRELKRDFGTRLAFHGGIDIQQVLPFGSEADVEQEVYSRIQAFAPGGGYILAPSHAIQADVPPANIVAMCRAAVKHGQYPLKSPEGT